MKNRRLMVIVGVTFVTGMATGMCLVRYGTPDMSFATTAHATGSDTDKPSMSPVKARARDFYAPNSEALGPNEMRLIACGTGMPTARPKQAATCFLLELGNGDKFLFDIGTGSAERISALHPAGPRTGPGRAWLAAAPW